tara:strand:- start:1669 stop:1980 length:312 start_codon:yes stop_codon:yes gene_type:complete
MRKRNKHIVCADGFKMSVQAHEGAYCTPRISDADYYSHVEIGYPSHVEPLILSYAEQKDRPMDTVYGYVPRERVMLVVLKHGGQISGQMPNGIPILPPPKKNE